MGSGVLFCNSVVSSVKVKLTRILLVVKKSRLNPFQLGADGCLSTANMLLSCTSCIMRSIYNSAISYQTNSLQKPNILKRSILTKPISKIQVQGVWLNLAEWFSSHFLFLIIRFWILERLEVYKLNWTLPLHWCSPRPL